MYVGFFCYDVLVDWFEGITIKFEWVMSYMVLHLMFEDFVLKMFCGV